MSFSIVLLVMKEMAVFQLVECLLGRCGWRSSHHAARLSSFRYDPGLNSRLCVVRRWCMIPPDLLSYASLRVVAGGWFPIW